MADRTPPSAVPLQSSKPGVSLLIYGHLGIGKTVFGSGPGGASLTISTEKDEGISAKKAGGTGEIVVCRSLDEFLSAKEAWEDGYYGNPEWTSFDAWTSMQERMKTAVLEREFGKDPTRKRDVMQIQDHLEYQNMTKRIISELCDSPRNVLFTAHDQMITSEEGEDEVIPLLDGKDGGIAKICASMVTSIGYMRLIQKSTGDTEKDVEDIRRIYWQPRPPYMAKDWTGSLGRWTDNATLEEISDKIFSGGPAKKPAARKAPAKAAVRDLDVGTAEEAVRVAQEPLSAAQRRAQRSRR